MKTKFEILQEVIEGRADEQTLAAVNAELEDPNSELRRFFEAMRRSVTESPMGDISIVYELLRDDDDHELDEPVSTEPSPDDATAFDTVERTKKPDEPPSLHPAPSPHTRPLHPRRMRLSKPAIAAALAMAASLFVGIALGRLVFSVRPSLPVREILVAQATIDRRNGRGTNAPFTVNIDSPRDGFATIIRYSPAQEPEDVLIDPEVYEATDLRVEASTPLEYGPLTGSNDDDVLLVVITKTPATDTIRRFVKNINSLPRRPDDLATDVREHLWKTGYDWVATAQAHIPGPESQ